MRKHRRSPSERMKQILASNIRSYRKKRKLSQEELAAICDLHRTYVGSVERGERNVTLGTLEALSSALGVSIAAMLSEGGITDDD